MGDTVMLLPQVTVYRHRFWFRDHESVCYHVDPDTAHDIIFHAKLLPAAVREIKRHIGLGAMRVTRTVTATVELPLTTQSIGVQAVPVSASWILHIWPLLTKALELYQKSSESSFTLAFDDMDNIIHMEPDRQSIPPNKTEEGET